MASESIVDSLAALVLETKPVLDDGREKDTNTPSPSRGRSAGRGRGRGPGPGRGPGRGRGRGGGRGRGQARGTQATTTTRGTGEGSKLRGSAGRSTVPGVASKPKPKASAGPTDTRQADNLPSQDRPTLQQPQASGNTDRPAHLYVVQTCDYKLRQRTVGVFEDLARANKCAEGCVARHGFPPEEITDISDSSLFGHTAWPTAVSRRSWPGGTSELRGGGFEWIKVMPKEWSASASTSTPGSGVAYLAFSGTLVIGAYGSKHEAWEACRRNWEQLSYWTAMEVDMWVDKGGMYHGEGTILGRLRHWFVAPFVINAEVASGMGYGL